MAAGKPPVTAGYASYLKPGERLPLPDIPPQTIALADLAPDRKRALWAWMQTNDPAMVDFLRGYKADPAVQSLEDAFGPVRPVVTLDYVRRAIG